MKDPSIHRRQIYPWRPGPRAWWQAWGRHPGYWAFVLHRITGIGLIAYLVLHLWMLRLLVEGQQAWDAFIQLAKSPLFLALDGLLLAGLVYHGLNGLRLAWLGRGRVDASPERGVWFVLLISALLWLLGMVALVVAVR